MPARRRWWPWAISAILCTALAATPAAARTIRVLFMGLGNGAVQSDDGLVDCTSGDAACTGSYSSPWSGPVLLTATPQPGSAFVGWEGDCSGSGNCTVWNHQNRYVRAVFRRINEVPLTSADVTPTGLAYFLSTNPDVTTPARFLRALPSEYKQGWILMTRSASPQAGTARLPGVLLPSADAHNVFTIGIAAHASYRGAHASAIEYMQWDALQKNFRFHEIVLDTIPTVTATGPDGTSVETIPMRTRGIRVDEPRCTRCHSTAGGKTAFHGV